MGRAHGRDVYKILVPKPEGKRPLGRPRLGRDYNIKVDHNEIGCEDLKWFHVPQSVIPR
jgi:hypothetical protein